MNDAYNRREHASAENGHEQPISRARDRETPKQTQWNNDEDNVPDDVRCTPMKSCQQHTGREHTMGKN